MVIFSCKNIFKQKKYYSHEDPLKTLRNTFSLEVFTHSYTNYNSWTHWQPHPLPQWHFFKFCKITTMNSSTDHWILSRTCSNLGQHAIHWIQYIVYFSQYMTLLGHIACLSLTHTSQNQLLHTETVINYLLETQTDISTCKSFGFVYYVCSFFYLARIQKYVAWPT